MLTTTEDFPLGHYPSGPTRQVYSRPATRALLQSQVFSPTWPITMATAAEADAYWDVREAVRLYVGATVAMTGLRGMVLASVYDHVQSAPHKPHIRQAHEGWRSAGAWVRINPDPLYLLEADPALSVAILPDNPPNLPPLDWSDGLAYCIPESVPDGTYQLAAIWEMADRTRAGRWYSIYLPIVTRGSS